MDVNAKYRTLVSPQIRTILVHASGTPCVASRSLIRHRFMDTPFLSAAFQVVVGGTLVFLAGILIGSS